MKIRKILLMKSVVLVIAFLSVDVTFSQVKDERETYITGLIDAISRDLSFISVNERRIFLSSDTKVTDEKGNVLRIGDLKPKTSVIVEGIRKPSGVFARRIVVRRTKGKP